MLKCKICECEFIPVIDKHYVARDNGKSGLSTTFANVEGNLYDAFNCPACGCQIIAQERKRNDYHETLTTLAKNQKEDEEEHENEE